MYSTSGKKIRVMICCVTFETAKVADPVRYYDCNRVHIIHYIKDDTEKNNVYREFYDETCRLIKESNGEGIEIIEHNDSVSDFSRMLALILSIIETEQSEGECDMFVNISAGSSEYSAAAAIGSMMSQNVLPFTVNALKYTIENDDDVRKVFYREGRPVGLTASTREPRKMPKYTIEKPKEHLVKGLRVLHEMNQKRSKVKSSHIVPILKEKGMWHRDPSPVKQSDAVNFRRDFVEKWENQGWVQKDELRKRYVLTDQGENIIRTFYIDDGR